MEMYLALLVTSFVAATIVPLSSEVIFVAAIHFGYSPWLCIALAGLGNCAGTALNYIGGRYGGTYLVERWLKFDQQRLETYARKHKHYGVVFLLASWLPIVGDPITIYAGLVRWPFAQFAGIVFSTRVLRYVLIYWLISAAPLGRH